jgi:cytochrome c5
VSTHDRHFFDTFMLVLGILIAIAVVLYFLSKVVGGRTQVAQLHEDPAFQQGIESRIEPFGRVAIAGQDNSALEAAEPPAAMQTAAVKEDLSGEEVYNMACVACHGQGIAGAPKLGDAQAWAARISKGMDTLHKHAIEGFQGSAGFMPPKGGRVDIADESIAAAVDYMVEAAGS